jgi:threonine dehydratase
MIAFADILDARRRIAGAVTRTPLRKSAALSERIGGDLYLKLEHWQETGAFKLRGAANAVRRLSGAPGVVAASTGNHGRAVAAAARAAGLPATICLSRLVPEAKVRSVRAMGAEVRIVGDSQDDAQVEAERLARDEGLAMLPPFDHPDVIAGQGACGLEIAEDLPDAGTVLVPLSGGGLLAGVALALKTMLPGVRIVGISMARGAAMAESLRAGRPVAVRELPTLADSLGGGIGLENRHTFAMVRDLADDIVLLDEAEIAEGVRWAYAEEREVLEGGGAVAIAALLCGKVRAQGPTVCLLSGRNIDMDQHRDIVSGRWREAPCPAS